jgi:hypothetical protein
MAFRRKAQQQLRYIGMGVAGNGGQSPLRRTCQGAAVRQPLRAHDVKLTSLGLNGWIESYDVGPKAGFVVR